MAGPIRITVDTNARSAIRDLGSIKAAVLGLGRVKVLSPMRNEHVSLKQAARDYKALGGEARETLSDINRRSAEAEHAVHKLGDRVADGTKKLKLMALGAAAVALAGRGISAAGGYLKQAVTDASNLTETASKAGNIFGRSTGEIQRFASTSAKSLGLSRAAALDGLSSFGNFFNQIHIGAGQSVKMSEGLVKLSADLGSFNNADPAQVMEAFQSATRGEMDALQRFIPTVSAATVQAEALRLTHKKSVKDLTDADKATALYAIAQRDAGKAQNDYKRTSDGLANVVRTNQAGFHDLSATIGTAFYPAVTSVAIIIRDKLLPFLNVLVTRYAPRVNKFFLDLARNGFSASADLGQAGAAIKVISESLLRFGMASGGGLTDTLTVASVLTKFLADNADKLSRALPYVITAYGLYRLALLAANVAATLSVPLKIAELVLNFQLAKSNRALVASRAQETVAVVTGTVAENVATASKERGVIATVASRGAMLAGAAATGIATTATVAFGIAVDLALGPVGVIILAVAALALSFRYAWAHSKMFRAMIKSTVGMLQSAASGVARFVSTVGGMFGGLRDSIAGIFGGLGHLITGALKAAVNVAVSLLNQPLRAYNAIAGRVPGVPSVPLIPALARGGLITRPTLVLAGEAGPEAIVPLNGRYGTGDTYIVNLTVQAGIGDPVAIGRESVRAIQAYERSTRRSLMSNPAA